MSFLDDLNEKWHGFLEFAAGKGIPLQSFADFLEDRGIPSLPVFAVILLLLFAGVYFAFGGGNQIAGLFKNSNDVSIQVKGAGVGLSGASVTLNFEDSRQSLTAVTHSDGSVLFKNVAVGAFTVSASADGYQPSTGNRYEFTDPVKIFSQSVNLDPIRNLKVDLTVNVEGVSEANVTLLDANEKQIDSSHHIVATFSVDPNSNYIIFATSGANAKKQPVYVSDIAQSATISFGNVTPASTTQTVHVCASTDSSCIGTGMPNATIIVRDTVTGAQLSKGVTGSDGYVEPFDLATGANVTVSAVLEGFSIDPKEFIVSDSESSNYFNLQLVNISLADRAQISVEARDAYSNTQIFNVLVRVLDDKKKIVEEKIGEAGTASITVRRNKAYYVVLLKDSYLPLVVQKVSAGSYVFKMHAADYSNSGSISVEALGADSAAAAGAKFSVKSAGLPFAFEQQADLDGKANFLDLAPGLYDVSASMNEKTATQKASVVAGVDSPVKIRFQKSSSKISFTLLNQFSKAPISSARVELEDSNFSCTTNIKGQCTIKALEGAYVAKATASGFQTLESEFFSALPGNSSKTLELESLEAARAAKMEFLGLYDLKGNKVSSLQPSTIYNARFTISSPLSLEPSLKTVAVVQFAKRDVPVANMVSFAGANAFVLSGVGDFAYSTVNSSVFPAQWIAFDFSKMTGTKQVEVQIKTNAVESGTLQVQYKAGFFLTNQQIFDPASLLQSGQTLVSSILPSSSADQSQDAVQARFDSFIQQLSQSDSKKSDFPISFEGKCQGDYCFQLYFDQANVKTGVDNFEAELGDFKLGFKILPSTANISNAQVTISTDSNALQISQLQTNAQTITAPTNSHSSTLSATVKPDQQDESAATIKATRLSKDASIKFSAALPGTLFEQIIPIRVVGKNAPILKVLARPASVEALKDNAISFEVKDSAGLPVEGAKVSIGSQFDPLKATVEAVEQGKGIYSASITPLGVGQMEYVVEAEGFKTFRGILQTSATQLFETDTPRIDLQLQNFDPQTGEFSLHNLLDNSLAVDISVQKKQSKYSTSSISPQSFALAAQETKTVSLNSQLLNSILQVAETPETLSEKIDGFVIINARAGASSQQFKIPFSINVQYKQTAIASTWATGADALEFDLSGPNAQLQDQLLTLYNNAPYALLLNTEFKQPFAAGGFATRFRIDQPSVVLPQLTASQYKVTAVSQSTPGGCVFAPVTQEGALHIVASFQGVASDKNIKLTAKIPASDSCAVQNAAEPFQVPVPFTILLPAGAKQKQNPDDSTFVQAGTANSPNDQMQFTGATARQNSIDIPFGGQIVLPASKVTRLAGGAAGNGLTFSIPAQIQMTIPKESNLSVEGGRLAITVGDASVGIYQMLLPVVPNVQKEKTIVLQPSVPITIKALQPPETQESPISQFDKIDAATIAAKAAANAAEEEALYKDLKQKEQDAKLKAKQDAIVKQDIAKTCAVQTDCSAFLACQNLQCVDYTPTMKDNVDVTIPVRLILQLPAAAIVKRESGEVAVIFAGRTSSFQNAQMVQTPQGMLLTVVENSIMSLPQEQVLRLTNPVLGLPGYVGIPNQYSETNTITIRFPFPVKAVAQKQQEIFQNGDGTQSILLPEDEVIIPSSPPFVQPDGSKQILVAPNAFISKKPIDINVIEGEEVKLGIEATFQASTPTAKSKIRDNNGGSVAVQLQDGRKVMFKDGATIEAKTDSKNIKTLDTSTIVLAKSMVRQIKTADKPPIEATEVKIPFKWSFKIPQGAQVETGNGKTTISLSSTSLRISKEIKTTTAGTVVDISENTPVLVLPLGTKDQYQQIILQYPYQVTFEVNAQQKDSMVEGSSVTEFQLDSCKRVAIDEGDQGRTTTPMISKIIVPKCGTDGVTCTNPSGLDRRVTVPKSLDTGAKIIRVYVCLGPEIKDEDKRIKKFFGQNVNFNLPAGLHLDNSVSGQVHVALGGPTDLQLVVGDYAASWLTSYDIWFPSTGLDAAKIDKINNAESKVLSISKGQEVEFMPAYDRNGQGLPLKISENVGKVTLEEPGIVVTFDATKDPLATEPKDAVIHIINNYKKDVSIRSTQISKALEKVTGTSEKYISLPETFFKGLTKTPLASKASTEVAVHFELPSDYYDVGTKCIEYSRDLAGTLDIEIQPDGNVEFPLIHVPVKVHIVKQAETYEECLARVHASLSAPGINAAAAKLGGVFSSNSQTPLPPTATFQAPTLAFKGENQLNYFTFSNNFDVDLTLQVVQRDNAIDCAILGKSAPNVDGAIVKAGDTIIVQCKSTATSKENFASGYKIIANDAQGVQKGYVDLDVSTSVLTTDAQKAVYTSSPLGELAPKTATAPVQPNSQTQQTNQPAVQNPAASQNQQSNTGQTAPTKSGLQGPETAPSATFEEAKPSLFTANVVRISFAPGDAAPTDTTAGANAKPAAAVAVTPQKVLDDAAQKKAAADAAAKVVASQSSADLQLKNQITPEIALCENYFCDSTQTKTALASFASSVQDIVYKLHGTNDAAFTEYCKNAQTDSTGRKERVYSIAIRKTNGPLNVNKGDDIDRELAKQLTPQGLNVAGGFGGGPKPSSMTACGIYVVKAEVRGCESGSLHDFETKTGAGQIDMIIPQPSTTPQANFIPCEQTLANALLLTAGDKEYVVGKRVATASEPARLVTNGGEGLKGIGTVITAGFTDKTVVQGLEQAGILALGRYGKENNENDIKASGTVESQLYNGQFQLPVGNGAIPYVDNAYCAKSAASVLLSTGATDLAIGGICGAIGTYLSPTVAAKCIPSLITAASVGLAGCVAAIPGEGVAKLVRGFEAGSYTCNVANICSASFAFSIVSALSSLAGIGTVTASTFVSASAEQVAFGAVLFGGVIPGIERYYGQEAGATVGAVVPFATHGVNIAHNIIRYGVGAQGRLIEATGLSKEDAAVVLDKIQKKDIANPQVYDSMRTVLDEYNARKLPFNQIPQNELIKRLAAQKQVRAEMENNVDPLVPTDAQAKILAANAIPADLLSKLETAVSAVPETAAATGTGNPPAGTPPVGSASNLKALAEYKAAVSQAEKAKQTPKGILGVFKKAPDAIEIQKQDGIIKNNNEIITFLEANLGDNLNEKITSAAAEISTAKSNLGTQTIEDFSEAEKNLAFAEGKQAGLIALLKLQNQAGFFDKVKAQITDLSNKADVLTAAVKQLQAEIDKTTDLSTAKKINDYNVKQADLKQKQSDLETLKGQAKQLQDFLPESLRNPPKTSDLYNINDFDVASAPNKIVLADLKLNGANARLQTVKDYELPVFYGDTLLVDQSAKAFLGKAMGIGKAVKLNVGTPGVSKTFSAQFIVQKLSQLKKDVITRLASHLPDSVKNARDKVAEFNKLSDRDKSAISTDVLDYSFDELGYNLVKVDPLLSLKENTIYIKINAEELSRKYLGEAPALVKSIFEVAKTLKQQKNADVVILLDELDVVTKRAGTRYDDGVVTALKNQLDIGNPNSALKEGGIYVIANTNDVTAFSSAVLSRMSVEVTPLPGTQAIKETIKNQLNLVALADNRADQPVELARIVNFMDDNMQYGFTFRPIDDFVSKAAQIISSKPLGSRQLTDDEIKSLYLNFISLQRSEFNSREAELQVQRQKNLVNGYIDEEIKLIDAALIQLTAFENHLNGNGPMPNAPQDKVEVSR